MLRFAMAALICGASAFVAAQAAIRLAPAGPPLRAAKAEAPIAAPAPDQAPPAAAAIPRSADGHYWATGDVGGRPVRFLVDTGATAVALTPRDAARLGLRPSDLRYSYQVVTAGGHARAAAVRLTSVTVGGARIENVDALVIESGLDASLLGMTYLGRLSRFEASRRGLVLQS